MLRVASALLLAAAPAAAADAAGLSFLVMGDWGGSETAPYTSDGEISTAAGMGKVASEMNAPFALAVGDNFYSHGISTDCNDARFKNTFEDVFTAPSLQGPDFKFHVIAGNHDHRGNVTAQIAYTALSNRWVYPESWYTFVKDSVQVVMIDTVILGGNSDVYDSDGNLVRELHGSDLPGPEDRARAQTQMQWLEATLKASTADYLLVVGHYPVWSVCEHGPTSALVADVKPLLEQYHATAYIAGHDHCMEYINEGTGVDYHVIGSAAFNIASTAHAGAIPAGSLKWHVQGRSGGFGSMSVTAAGLVARHHDGNGTVLFSAPARAPRSKVPTPPVPPQPTPAPGPAPSPAPGPAPAPGMQWECHANHTVAKSFAKNADLHKTGEGITSCEARCNGADGCAAVLWHKTDKHCHTISGSFTHDAFVAALSGNNDYDACVLAPQHH